MDGTLCDYDGAIIRDLKRLKSPDEPDFEYSPRYPDHIRHRIKLIRKVPGWWRNLSKLDIGFDIFNMCRDMGFKNSIATKGPSGNPNAWAEKVEWCRNNLPPDIDVHITEDKGALYGKVLVDDWPPYIERWLKWRPRGLVIMPAHPYNEEYEDRNKNHQVIRYDGNIKTYEEIKVRLQSILDRNSGVKS